MTLRLLNHAEQVAEHLRGELQKGRWSGVMPGILGLGKELGVNHNTIDAAMKLLEQEGLLESRGAGKPRRIASGIVSARLALRIRILLYERADRMQGYTVELLHRLIEAGHEAAFSRKTQHDLGMNAKRIARYVEGREADAWVVNAANRDVLNWFAQQPFPTFAMFGRMSGLPLAGMSPKKAPALAEALKRMAELGHSRIVLLTRGKNKFANPSLFEKAFLDELVGLGISPSPYNLPDWENSRKGLHKCLDSLFHLTPPTSLIVCEPPLFIAAQQHLAQRGILSPRDVSLVCDDPDEIFAWCRPSVAHISWDDHLIVNRVVHWANNVALGRKDIRQSRCASRFIDGDTIGPAPKG